MANRAWLYCRIDSGHEHEAKKLLDNQEQRLLDYCAQQGLQVTGCTKTVGSSKWGRSSVSCILQNERYVGNALLQKRFTTSSIPFRQVVNHGDMPQYYVEHSHQSIVPSSRYDHCLLLRKERNQTVRHFCLRKAIGDYEIGEYVTETDIVEEVDELAQALVLSGTFIPFTDIYDLQGDFSHADGEQTETVC